METSLGAADDNISLVSISNSSISSSCQKTTDSFKRQVHIRRYVLFLVTFIAVICMVLLSFIIVILIILLHQQSAITSLEKRLYALQNNGQQLEEGIAHISKAFGLPHEKVDQKHSYSHHKTEEATDRSTDVRHENRDAFNTSRKFNFSKMAIWNVSNHSMSEFEGTKTELQTMNEKLNSILLSVNGTGSDKEISYAITDLVKNISNQVLMNTISYLSKNTVKEPCNETSSYINKWHSVHMEIQDINKSIAIVLASLNETKVNEEISRNVSMDVLKDVANQSLMNTVPKLLNMLRKALRNVTMINNKENVMKFVAEVDTNIKQMNKSMKRIERYLNLLNEGDLHEENSLLLDINRTIYMPVALGMENETLCTPLISQSLPFQDTQVIEKIMNLTEVQLPALFQSQIEVLNELNEQFPLIHERLNRSGVKGTGKGEFYDSVQFCSSENSCSMFKVNLKHCYKVSGRSDPLLTWVEARDKCKELGGYLLEINSNLEIRAVERLADRKQTYWLGGTDVEKEGLWIWQHSRHPILLSTWKDGEPNNLGSEHCLQSVRGIRIWNDVPCSRKYRYICERNDGRCWE